MADQRPLDFGDQFPSDIGDIPPVNRIDGLSEADFDVSQPGSGRVRSTMRPPVRANPNANEAKKQDLHVQDGFIGVLTQRLDDRHWTVLRHDGLLITAITAGDQNIVEEFKIGEQCSLFRGPDASTWYIHATSKNKELSSIQLTNNGDIELTKGSSTTLDMSQIITLSGDSVQSNGQGFTVLFDRFALYKISYKVTALCTNPDPIDKDSSKVKVATFCFGEFTKTLNDYTPDKIDFRRNVGFKGGWDAANRIAQISIGIGETDYVPQSPSGGGDQIWTDEPHIANSIRVGTKQSQGWIKVVCTGDTYLWLGHGDKPLKLRFPNKAPEFASHLMVNGLADGGCTQLKWSKPGGKGKIKIECSYCDLNKEWKVEDGLIISGPDIEAPSQSDGEQAVCTSVDRTIWTCS